MEQEEGNNPGKAKSLDLSAIRQSTHVDPRPSGHSAWTQVVVRETAEVQYLKETKRSPHGAGLPSAGFLTSERMEICQHFWSLFHSPKSRSFVFLTQLDKRSHRKGSQNVGRNTEKNVSVIPLVMEFSLQLICKCWLWFVSGCYICTGAAVPSATLRLLCSQSQKISVWIDSDKLTFQFKGERKLKICQRISQTRAKAVLNAHYTVQLWSSIFWEFSISFFFFLLPHCDNKATSAIDSELWDFLLSSVLLCRCLSVAPSEKQHSQGCDMSRQHHALQEHLTNSGKANLFDIISVHNAKFVCVSLL